MSKHDLRSPDITAPIADLTAATPAEIDIRLEALQYEAYRIDARIGDAARSIYSYTGTRALTSKPGFRETREAVALSEAIRRAEEALAVHAENDGKAYNDRKPLPHGVQPYYVDNLATALTDLAERRAARKANKAEQAPLDDEYDRRGGWSRAFLVLNSNGHVHSSMSCSTCFLPRWDEDGILIYEGTRYGWLPTLSGHDEAEIVEKAGTDACTVCYPTAPVDKAAPRSIFHSTEVEAQEAREAERARRAAKKAEKEAKRLVDPDTGKNLRDPSNNWEIASEVTARNVYVDAAAKIEATKQGLSLYGRVADSVAKEEAYVEAFLRSMAAKHGKPEAEIVADLAKKVTARVKRDYR